MHWLGEAASGPVQKGRGMRRNKAEDPIDARRDEVEATDARLVEEVRSGDLKRWRCFATDLEPPARLWRWANGRAPKIARD